MAHRRSLPKPLNVDTPQMRAAINLVQAVDDNKTPDEGSLKVLRDAFYIIFGGTKPQDIFGHPLGLVHPPHKPKGYGFTSDDIVSAWIELTKRNYEANGLDAVSALKNAKREAKFEFNDIQNDDDRSIRRHWEKGENTVKNLSTADLEEIIAPYKI
ncbi:MAG: hypothetical protein PSV17_08170 [Methylotenera sp.]|uniref:hypothetical protein n=1 Tax=Methylotenera sp. TaxID=2051956 RepID=UPI00248844F5|nr:hypothetical protein [Methylotenera sp.]MDI1309396.1 hypothetical protein [Methylotenera sp.]